MYSVWLIIYPSFVINIWYNVTEYISILLKLAVWYIYISAEVIIWDSSLGMSFNSNNIRLPCSWRTLLTGAWKKKILIQYLTKYFILINYNM